MNKAIVVFSGGQDSTTCLIEAVHKHDYVLAVTFDYGQRHIKEIECAKKIIKDFNDDGFKVEHKIIDMSVINDITVNALTRDIKIAIDEDTGLPNTFVPGRNILFLTIASIVAYQIGASAIYTGVCQTDFSGYPDCRNDFVKALNYTLNIGLDKNIEIVTPLMWLNKAETWQLADSYGYLEYVADNTLTCYNGVIGAGCGECPACKLRAKGLEEYLNERR